MDERTRQSLQSGMKGSLSSSQPSSRAARAPFVLMRRVLAVLLFIVTLMYLFGGDQAKGSAIRIGVIAGLGIGVSLLVEQSITARSE